MLWLENFKPCMITWDRGDGVEIDGLVCARRVVWVAVRRAVRESFNGEILK